MMSKSKIGVLCLNFEWVQDLEFEILNLLKKEGFCERENTYSDRG